MSTSVPKLIPVFNYNISQYSSSFSTKISFKKQFFDALLSRKYPNVLHGRLLQVQNIVKRLLLTSRVGGAPWHGLAHRTSKCLFVRYYFTGKDLYKSLHCHACNSWAQLFLLNADRRQGVRVTWTCDARSLEKMKPKYLVEEEFIFYSCGFSSVKPYLNFLSNTKFT